MRGISKPKPLSQPAGKRIPNPTVSSHAIYLPYESRITLPLNKKPRSLNSDQVVHKLSGHEGEDVGILQAQTLRHCEVFTPLGNTSSGSNRMRGGLWVTRSLHL